MRRLDGGLIENNPSQIRAARGVADLRGEFRIGKRVCKVERDRGGLSDDRIAMHDGRHFAHRIDREIGRRFVLALLQVEHFELVRWRAKLFEQPLIANERVCGA